MIRFSVIIPCYNSSLVIKRALDSLEGQTYKNFEIIVVDDCSTDDTLDVVRMYVKTMSVPIRILENIKNLGPGYSRNQGIKIAMGEYICFLDSDDYFDKTYFEVIAAHLDVTDSDVVYFGNYHVLGDKIREIGAESYKKNEYIAMSSGALWKFCSIKSLWDGVEIPPIKNAEDIAVIPVLLSKAQKITSVHRFLYYYVHSNESLSSTYKPDISRNFVKSFEYTEDRINRNKYFEELEFHGIKTVLYGATLNALKARVKRDEIKAFWRTFMTKYPKWYSNKYIKTYSKPKRVFLLLIRYNQIGLLQMFSFFHTSVLKTLVR